MDVTIAPKGKLSGTLDAPASKSAAHRMIICAALAGGDSDVYPIQLSEDMNATMRAATALGAGFRYDDQRQSLSIKGISSPATDAVIDCGESGSTLRFFVPIAAALGTTTVFTGQGALPLRPLGPLAQALTEHGVAFEKKADEIATISGKLKSGLYKIPGDISSQYISGLLFALPLLEGNSIIELTTPLQSRGYVDMTVDALSKFGVEIGLDQMDRWEIPGGQRYRPRTAQVEGDYSNAAFWLSAAAIQPETQITLTGLDPHSLQGDSAIIDILKRFGAAITVDAGGVTAKHSSLQGIDINVENIPDLVPVLAVVAALAKGTTTIYNAERVRLKESDRLATITKELTALGAQIQEEPAKLMIHGNGGEQLMGGVCDSHNDHRIAMSLAVAALVAEKPLTVTGAQCVNKSYPDFWNDYVRLGGKIDVV